MVLNPRRPNLQLNPRDMEELDLPQDEPLEDNNVQELLEAAHKELLMDLLKKLRSGEIGHQELSILRNFLRDNGMVISPLAQNWEDNPPEPGGTTTLPDLADPLYDNE